MVFYWQLLIQNMIYLAKERISSGKKKKYQKFIHMWWLINKSEFVVEVLIVTFLAVYSDKRVITFWKVVCFARGPRCFSLSSIYLVYNCNILDLCTRLISLILNEQQLFLSAVALLCNTRRDWHLRVAINIMNLFQALIIALIILLSLLLHWL